MSARSLTRRDALALIASTAALHACASRPTAIRVASKNFTESIVLGELYAQTLEGADLPVERKLNLGSTEIALAALTHGDIDVYPEYTGTALLDVLHRSPVSNPRVALAIVRGGFAQRYDASWLEPAPMNDSQALATTPAIAQQYGLNTLSQLAMLAPRLRLATIPEFLTRPDALPGLQRAYGGFRFADVRTYDIGIKYAALLAGNADVATAFTTDGEILEYKLIVLRDDRHFWPPYNVAPVVRNDTLRRFPAIVKPLNALSARIDDAAMRRMNLAVVRDKRDPADVAAAFIAGKRS